MARRERDYKAEYERRIAKAKVKGLTKAQARRGARKYAASQPREHIQRAQGTAKKYGTTPRKVTQQRLARRKVKGVGKSRMDIQRFHSLNRAMDFAAGLPSRSGIYIVGHGTFRVSSKYQGKARGWAALNDYWDPERFSNPDRRRQLAKKDSEVFEPKATTYEVRWSSE